MKKLANLPKGTDVCIDANIFALAYTNQGTLGDVSRAFLERIRLGELAGFTAAFIVAEVIHRLMVVEARKLLGLSSRETVEYLQKHPDMVKGLREHLPVASNIKNIGIDILPLTVQDLHASKLFRSTYGLLTNDSLILGVLRRRRLTHLATHDAAFAQVANIQVWMPGA